MNKIIALLTDFGLNNHFVGTMKGVILTVDPEINIYDITHQIQPQNILEAAYSLADTIPYWPENTLFAVVVDPGVGTSRRSLIVRAGTGHGIICPDNGILTLVEQEFGLLDVYEICVKNRLPGTNAYHTFHGRDIYAYNAARIVSGKVISSEIGHPIKNPIERLKIHEAKITHENIHGNIVKIEKPYGNLCTNIPMHLFSILKISYGDYLEYIIFEDGKERLKGKLPFVRTFGEVVHNEALLYIDSSGRLGFAINRGDFSDNFQIYAGTTWEVRLKKQAVKKN